jgi:predicted extracellular nuclease
MKKRVKWIVFILVIGAVASVLVVGAQAQPTLLPIGAIQGAGDVSPYLNRFVNFRGIVVGRYEDQNTRGDVYYTLFVQDLPDASDGDPATSDGIAVFLGRQPRADIPLGAVVAVGGKVTEFYGLTEIDDKGLVVTIEEPAGLLPAPVFIDPPVDMIELAAYFEALEGMRVAYEGGVVVAGPTHEGCGFAVIDEVAATELPMIRRADDDPVGRVVPVLYPGDLNCDDIPQVKTGDRITGLAGALTYNFDQFKIIFDTPDQLTVEPAPRPELPGLPETGPEQIVVASINAENYFDTTRDTDEEGEPVLTDEELAARQAKLAHLVANALECPTLIGVQEVEHEALLRDLSAALEAPCGFAYQVSHLESADARGIDNALLSDSRRVRIDAVALRQACSPVPTGIADPSVACAPGEEPLFGRPPLQVDARIDGRPFTLFVNHFKSKRGGETETDLERVRQAVVLNKMAADLLAVDPAAWVIALGDFNDTNRSPVLALLTDPAQGGVFANAPTVAPESTPYSYNFGGVSELIDSILVSPALVGESAWTTVVHVGTDFPVGWRLDTSPERLPFRATDHDIPVVYFGQWPPTPEPEPTAAATPVGGRQTTDERTPVRRPQPTVVALETTPTAHVTGAPSAVAEPGATPVTELSVGETLPGTFPWIPALMGVVALLLLALLYQARR